MDIYSFPYMYIYLIGGVLFLGGVFAGAVIASLISWPVIEMDMKRRERLRSRS